MRLRWPWGREKQRISGCSWSVKVAGGGIGRGVREAVRWRVQDMRLREYMHSRGLGKGHDRLSRVMMELGHRDPEHGVGEAVRVARSMWGHLATRDYMHRQGRAEGCGCPMEGCGGECEDGWHVMGECRGKGMRETRRSVVEGMLGKVRKIEGVGREMQWMIRALWGLDGEGCLMRWEELDWEEYEEAVGEQQRGSEGCRGSLKRVCSESGKGKQKECGRTDLRVRSWVNVEWEEECVRGGMRRGVAVKLMRCIEEEMHRLCNSSWQVRNREVHGVGKESEQEVMMVREIECMREEMGRRGPVSRVGGMRRLREVRRELKRELKEWRLSRKQQPRIDDVLGGGTLHVRVRGGGQWAAGGR